MFYVFSWCFFERQENVIQILIHMISFQRADVRSGYLKNAAGLLSDSIISVRCRQVPARIDSMFPAFFQILRHFGMFL